MANETITFCDLEFFRSHGRAPKGRGSWAFCPDEVKDDGDYLDHTWFSPSMTFKEARAAAKAHFAAKGFTGVLSVLG